MRLEPEKIVDGQVVIAFAGNVVVMVLRVHEWSVELMERLYEESMARTGANAHALIRVEGTAPGPTVRKRQAELQAELDARIRTEGRRVAIVTDSAVVRGAMTAMRWLTGEKVHGFSTDHVTLAASWASGRDECGDVVDAYEKCVRV